MKKDWTGIITKVREKSLFRTALLMTGAELPCSLQGICDAEQSCRASLPPRGVHGGSEAGKDALKGCPNAVLPPHPYPELQVHRASPQKEGAGAQPPPRPEVCCSEGTLERPPRKRSTSVRICRQCLAEESREVTLLPVNPQVR